MTAENRVVNVTAKVTPSQKAEFKQKAIENDLSLSEWACSILEMGKDNYENIKYENQKIIDLEKSCSEKDKLIRLLTDALENEKKGTKKKDEELDLFKNMIDFYKTTKNKNKDEIITLKKIAENLKAKLLEKKPEKSSTTKFLYMK